MMKPRMIIKGESGVAAIEFAIVLPVLLLLLFGIIEFSVLLYDKAMITNASREGARAGIVFKDASTDRLSEPQIKAIVDAYCLAHLINFSETDPPDTDIDPENPELGGVNSGDPLTVTVSYTYNFFVLPNLPFMSSSFKDWLDLKAITVMRYE